jgi:hypothetical protein
MWDKGWSFYKDVPELDADMDPPLRYWTGSPFGPDTIAGTLRAGFRSSAGWYMGGSFIFSAQGERSDLGIFDRDNSVDDTYRPSHKVYDVTVPPTGIPIYTFTASFSFQKNLSEWLSFGILPGYRAAINIGHVEGRTEHGPQIAMYLRYRPFNR